MGTGRTPSTPGWYPDPWGPQGALRYWSGAAWTSEVGPPAPPQAPEQDGERASTGLKVFGIGGLALVVLVVATIMLVSRGQDVGEISTPVLGVKFTSSQVAQAQPELEARLAQLEQRAGQDQASAPAAVTALDISGVWNGPAADYVITQYGTEVVVEEVTAYGTTGVGIGLFDGELLQIQYEALDGSTGLGEFMIVGGDTLSGAFQNSTYGTIESAVLTRS
jgi:Protein of unknown function (DUF2510)